MAKTPNPIIVNEPAPDPKETVLEKSPEPAVQHAVDEANERGYIGVKTDPLPNEHYTVAGQIAAKAEKN